MILQAIISFLFGVLNCFFGWQLFRLVLGIWGFVTGAAIAARVAGIPLDDPLAFLPVIIGGILGALIFSVLYVVGIVLLGAVFGFTLTAALAGSVIQIGDFTLFLIGAVGALGFGLLAWWLNKRIIFLMTAFSGAAGMVNAGLLVFGYRTPVTDLLTTTATEPLTEAAAVPQGVALMAVAAWLVLGVMGLLVQWDRVRD